MTGGRGEGFRFQRVSGGFRGFQVSGFRFQVSSFRRFQVSGGFRRFQVSGVGVRAMLG